MLFLILEWIAISAYAYMGLHMCRWFEPRGKKIFKLCCAGLLSGAASVLLARRA